MGMLYLVPYPPQNLQSYQKLPPSNLPPVSSNWKVATKPAILPSLAPKRVGGTPSAHPTTTTTTPKPKAPIQDESAGKEPGDAYEPGKTIMFRSAHDVRVYGFHGEPQTDRIAVYFHGDCGDVSAFRFFAPVMKSWASLISLKGDIPCPKHEGRFRWSGDLRVMKSRIDDAIAALEELRGKPFDHQHIPLIGYSAGTIQVELLAEKYPKLHDRTMVIAGPVTPSARRFRKSKAVVIMVGQYDRQSHLKYGHTLFQKVGIPSRFFELPKAAHGKYGPNVVEVMEKAIPWMFTHGKDT
jgi:predicted esterase